MTEGKSISDEELTAYLDGEASQDLETRIRGALQTDARVAGRLKGLELPKEDIENAFGSVLSHAPIPPAELINIADKRPARPALIAASAALLVGLVIGVASSNLVTSPPKPWLEAVAIYQSLYIPETVALAPGQSPDTDKLAALSREIALDLEGLSDVDGLSFRRAQLLGYEGKPLIQIVYATPDGTPIALCILADDAAKQDVKTGVLAGLSSASWRTGSHGVLLIGGTDDTLIEHIALALEDRV